MLAFKFSLFIHGKTSVVATVKMEEKMSVRTLSHTDLAKSSKGKIFIEANEKNLQKLKMESFATIVDG